MNEQVKTQRWRWQIIAWRAKGADAKNTVCNGFGTVFFGDIWQHLVAMASTSRLQVGLRLPRQTPALARLSDRFQAKARVRSGAPPRSIERIWHAAHNILSN